MKKVICIGECSLNIDIDGGGVPVCSAVGGRMACAAMALGRAGVPVFMCSDVSADAVGDVVVGHLAAAGVDLTGIDRITEGRTALNVDVADGDGVGGVGTVCTVRYESYPDECFDIVWPRVDEGDVVVYGGYYAIDGRMRPRLQRFLQHCRERNAVLVYVPGFMPAQQPRITRVMPAVLDNLELADLTVLRDSDLPHIFGCDSSARAYRERICFYCPDMIAVDSADGMLRHYTEGGVTEEPIDATASRTMAWNGELLARIARNILKSKS